jgi:peptidoglycan/LPS O-acetylase OafA/YrhL
MSVARNAFRPDLEGLRGVAILLVVLFHAGALVAKGGFVGVDVFFVLSGFFITRMLVGEMVETGSVDLNGFYGKRALRLLPALLVVLLATLVAVMWLYAPIDRAEIARNARAVALYAGNIEFARSATDYFRAQENPLLHTWSLGVEEQFYLVWPLLFLGVAAAFARTIEVEDDVESRLRVLYIIAAVGLVSFGVSLWVTAVAQPWAFFGMPTRIWEFAAGGALAITMIDREDRIPGAAIALQVIGLGTIAFGVIAYDMTTPYPGIAAVVPAVGALALIVGGARAPESFISRSLAIRPLRFLGRLSYAWYLWHWPLMGLGAVLVPGIGVVGKLAWSALALVLAWLTLRFIEEPARNGGALARIPARWLTPLALGASASVAVASHVAMGVARREASVMPQKLFAAARGDRVEGCWAETMGNWNGPCAYGDKSSGTVLALLGDSHADHWLGGLDRAGKEHGWKVLAHIKGGCPVSDIPQRFSGRLKKLYGHCAEFREAMIQRIIAMKPRAVILSNSDEYMAFGAERSIWKIAPAEWQAGLRRTYERFHAAGIPMIVMRDTPNMAIDPPVCLSRYAARLPFAKPCVYDRRKAYSPPAIAAQNEAARGLNVTFLDMNDQICTTPRCSVMKNGIVMFTDDDHLTASFTRSLGSVLGHRIALSLHEATGN